MSEEERMMMNAKTEKLVRRTTMVATATAAYFLLTADYGPHPNALDPIKKAIESAQSSAKAYMLGSKGEKPGTDTSNKPKT